MEENRKYIIGLDLGSGTVGFAATYADNFDLVKKNGQSLWGTRLFDEAEDASNRRSLRRQRRTINKRSWRLHLLKQELKKYVLKEDENFYKKINKSYEKKEGLEKYTLFNEKNYTDVDYYKEFPTIFHLRQALMDENKVKIFINRNIYYRFLFLGINDILKSRGNFINNNIHLSAEGNISKKNIYKNIEDLVNSINKVNDEYENGIYLDYDTIISLLENEDFSGRKQNDNILFVKIIRGYKFDFAKLFSKEKDVKIDLDLSSEKFEEDYENVIEHRDILEDLYKIYNQLKTNSILQNSKSISESKINVYNEFKNQLQEFKNLTKKIDHTLSTNKYYDSIFRDTNNQISLFSRFISKKRDLNELGKKLNIKKISALSKIDFLKEINKLIDEIEKNDNARDLANELKILINKDNFLIKPTNTDNRVIPYQLHLFELEKMLIIFDKTTESITPIKNHILRIMEFKVPYYVGPLGVNTDKNHDKTNDNYWLIKNSNEKITPFNFDTVVNKEETNKKFIENMLRTCTYLYSEKCLEQETILYQNYIFYNTINKIQLDGVNISNNQKDICYNALLKGRSLTQKFFKDTFKCKIIDGMGKDETKKLDVSLSALKSFLKIFPNNNYEPYTSLFDDVVCILTFCDKNEVAIRKEKVNDIIKNNSDYSKLTISQDQIEKLSLLTSKKRGNLSRKFLNGIESVNGTQSTIIKILKETNGNLMEILYSDEHEFFDQIDEINSSKSNISYDFTKSSNINIYLKERYVAPQVRRSIIQAFAVVNELVQIIGYDPYRVAIEFTRTNELKDKGKETVSRYNEFKKIYDTKLKEEIYNEIKRDLENYEKKTDNLNSKKLFLYFSQLGKDIYTGLPIDLNDLFKSNIYDIDHIYPQSKLKDDSIRNNLVLVNKITNGDKTNNYPINLNIRTIQNKQWKLLLDLDLITKEKYNRLIRDTPLSDEELQDFVNRQKTTLDWTNKLTAEMLKIRFKKTNLGDEFIIYSKSKHVSDFRETNEFYKVRALNDFHHAFDAYLNAVIGETLKNKLSYFSETSNFPGTFNYQTILERNLVKFDSKFRKYYNYSDFLISKRNNKKFTGEFWDQTIYSPGENVDADGTISTKRKGKPLGIYKKPAICFFSIIKYLDKNNKEIFQFIPIEKYKVEQLLVDGKIDNNKLLKYIITKFKISNIDLIPGCEVLYPGQLMICDGIKMRLGGKTGDRLTLHNSVQLKLTFENVCYLRKIIKFKEKTAKYWVQIIDGKRKLSSYEISILIEEKNKTQNQIKKSEEEIVKIVKSKNETIYKELSRKVTNYSSLVSGVFNQYEDRFFDSIPKQIDVIYTLITSIFKANGACNCTIFGKGKISFSILQKTTKPLTIIKESVTGFYNKEIIVIK